MTVCLHVLINGTVIQLYVLQRGRERETLQKQMFLVSEESNLRTEQNRLKPLT